MGSRLAGVVALGALLATFVGCGSEAAGPKLVPLTGTVTLDGKPIEAAVVSIIPSKGGAAQSATTDAAGKFSMQSVEGEHKVAVSKVEASGGPASADGLAPDFAAAPQKVKFIVPERYGRMDLSVLTIKVPAGGGDVGTIPLTVK